MKRVAGSVALLLCVIAFVSLGLTAAFGVKAPQKTDDITVVASFYPLYTAALNVVGACDGVTVSCLTRPQAGCLHDYQLSPAERAALGEADVLLQNGAGMESFLDSAVESLSELTAIDTSVGLELLSCEEHDHDHDHEHSVNAHVWIDPALYAEQVKRVCDGLCEADPAHAAEYEANAEAYLQKIATVERELNSFTSPLTHALLFHESVAYAARVLRLETVGVVPLGENEAASAADLAELADALKGKAVLLLYDKQYTAQYESLARYADKAAIVRWNTAVQPINGVAAKDVWLVAMQENLKALKEAVA